MNEKKERSPTPNLGVPKSKNQFFTHQENKLLDQITLEINEAWAKDLRSISKTHRRALELMEAIKGIEDKFPALERFLSDNEFIYAFKIMRTNIEEINSRLIDMNLRIFNLEQKIEYPHVQALNGSIKSLEQTLEDLKKQMQEKPKKTLFKKFIECFRNPN